MNSLSMATNKVGHGHTGHTGHAGNVTPSIVLNTNTMTMGEQMEDRDPYDLNKQVKVDWNHVIGEPDTHQSPDWVWKASSFVYTNVQSLTYKFLTILFAPIFSFFMAIFFAILAFVHIWFIRPFNKFFHIIFSALRNFLEIVFNGILAPLFETIGSCLSNIKIRHQKVHDARDESPFPFIA